MLMFLVIQLNAMRGSDIFIEEKTSNNKLSKQKHKNDTSIHK